MRDAQPAEQFRLCRVEQDDWSWAVTVASTSSTDDQMGIFLIYPIHRYEILSGTLNGQTPSAIYVVSLDRKRSDLILDLCQGVQVV